MFLFFSKLDTKERWKLALWQWFLMAIAFYSGYNHGQGFRLFSASNLRWVVLEVPVLTGVVAIPFAIWAYRRQKKAESAQNH
jgi:hypothetical protein